MSESITQALGAEICGLSGRRIRQLVQAGEGPPQDNNGHFPAREFGEWLKRRHLSGIVVGADGKSLDLESERARLAKEQADKYEMENSERRGVLADVEKLAAEWSRVGANIRTRLLSIPSTAAPQVAGLSIPEAKHIIEQLIHDALSELSESPPGTDTGASVEDSITSAAEANSKPVGGPRKKAKPGE